VKSRGFLSQLYKRKLHMAPRRTYTTINLFLERKALPKELYLFFFFTKRKSVV